jgi:hypothetical protein
MTPLLQSRELTLPGGDLSRSFLARTYRNFRRSPQKRPGRRYDPRLPIVSWFTGCSNAAAVIADRARGERGRGLRLRQAPDDGRSRSNSVRAIRLSRLRTTATATLTASSRLSV